MAENSGSEDIWMVRQKPSKNNCGSQKPSMCEVTAQGKGQCENLKDAVEAVKAKVSKAYQSPHCFPSTAYSSHEYTMKKDDRLGTRETKSNNLFTCDFTKGI